MRLFKQITAILLYNVRFQNLVFRCLLLNFFYYIFGFRLNYFFQAVYARYQVFELKTNLRVIYIYFATNHTNFAG